MPHQNCTWDGRETVGGGPHVLNTVCSMNVFEAVACMIVVVVVVVVVVESIH